jgi:hypothetical protein
VTWKAYFNAMEEISNWKILFWKPILEEISNWKMEDYFGTNWKILNVFTDTNLETWRKGTVQAMVMVLLQKAKAFEFISINF